jgi:hypothetical protein
MYEASLLSISSGLLAQLEPRHDASATASTGFYVERNLKNFCVLVEALLFAVMPGGPLATPVGARSKFAKLHADTDETARQHSVTINGVFNVPMAACALRLFRDACTKRFALKTCTSPPTRMMHQNNDETRG